MKAISWFVAKQLITRWKEICYSTDFIICILSFFLILMFGKNTVVKINTEAMAVSFITYSAIVLGFTVSSSAVAISLPSRFIRRIYRKKPKGKMADGFSQLLFIFSYAGIVHLIIVLFSIISLVLIGDIREKVCGHGLLSMAFISLLLSLVLYGVFRFMITFITLHQMGLTYLHDLTKNDPNNSEK